MDTEELNRHLRAATDDLTIRPGLAHTVVLGGRRRRVRHRMAIATAATAVAAIVGGSTYAMVSSREAPVFQNQVMAGWLAAETRGDLAGDQAFLDQALAAWEEGKGRSPNASAGIFDDTRGDAHVYWAGDTEAGRAAVVMQEAYLHPHEQLPPGAGDTLQALVGLVAVDPKDGELKLVGDQFQQKPTGPLPGAFMFGQDDTVMLVVDQGQRVWECHIALGLNPGEEPTEEQLRSQWTELTRTDGVAMTTFDAGTTPEFLVTGPDPLLDSKVELQYWRSSDYVAAARVGGTGPLPPAKSPGLLGWDQRWQVGEDRPMAEDEDMVRFRAIHGDNDVIMYPPGPRFASDTWSVNAGLDDGRVALLTALKEGDQPWRLLLLLVDPANPIETVERVDGPVLNRNIPLPVKMELPDGQGWLVAAKDRPLSYRTTGDWVDAGQSAALLPSDATQVKVGETVIDL